MTCEWDDNKNQLNIAKHGVCFEDACKIFDGPTVDAIDDRNDYGEQRTISIGLAGYVAILTVVHTDREGRIRLISARQATRQERRRYEKTIQ